jgi:hypothetical protein
MQTYANLYVINNQLFKGIYNLQKHLQKWNVMLECKLVLGTLQPKNKLKNQKLENKKLNKAKNIKNK